MTMKCAALCAALALCIRPGFAADPPTKAASTGNSTSPTPRAAIGAAAQAAVRAGVQTCAGRIDQVSQFVGANASVGAYLFAPAAPPDQRLVSLSYEVQAHAAAVPLAYASASFAPNQANGCGALYEAIVYWPQKCDVVMTRQFAEFRKGRPLHKDVLVLESETPARIFLMPAGEGCVSIKKELVL